jgi:hypothetical protein
LKQVPSNHGLVENKLLLLSRWEDNLLFILFFIVTTFGTRLGTLSLDTTSTAATIGRGQSKVNVLLGVL